MASNKLKSYIGYNPTNIEQFTEKEKRAAFGKLRAIANKRLEKLERYGYSELDTYKNIVKMFDSSRVPKISELDTSLDEALTEVSYFLRGMSTIQKIHSYENKQIQIFKSYGFKKINRNTLKKFGDFMERLRERYGARLRDSFRAVAVFEAAERLHVNPSVIWDNMEDYNTNLKVWENVEPFPARGRHYAYSAFNYRKRYQEALEKFKDVDLL